MPPKLEGILRTEERDLEAELDSGGNAAEVDVTAVKVVVLAGFAVKSNPVNDAVVHPDRQFTESGLFV